MFYVRFCELCQNKGIKPSAAVREMGLSSGNATYWKEGRIPKTEVLKCVASYFNVSVDYLLGEEKKTTDNDGLSEEEKALLDLFNRVPADSRPMILEMIRAAVNTL
jgi:transcriptional regulator with XRE-family HTH domain